MELRILEIAKDEVVPELDKELAMHLTALQYNPGFVYLVRKLRLQRSLLRETLENSRHKSLVDAEFLQSGIVWTGWLDQQIGQATNYLKRQAPPRELFQEEQRAFDEVAAQLEIVGR